MRNTPAEVRDYVTARQAVDAYLPADQGDALVALWSQGFPAMTPAVRLYVLRLAVSTPEWNVRFREYLDVARCDGRRDEEAHAVRSVLGSILDSDRPVWPVA